MVGLKIKKSTNIMTVPDFLFLEIDKLKKK